MQYKHFYEHVPLMTVAKNDRHEKTSRQLLCLMSCRSMILIYRKHVSAGFSVRRFCFMICYILTDREKIVKEFCLKNIKIYTIFAARFRKAVSNGNLKPCTANERIQKIQCCRSADAVQLLLFRYQPFLSYAYRAWVIRCPLSSWRRNGT